MKPSLLLFHIRLLVYHMQSKKVHAAGSCLNGKLLICLKKFDRKVVGAKEPSLVHSLCGDCFIHGSIQMRFIKIYMTWEFKCINEKHCTETSFLPQ
jgi:hypothetical protein